MAVLPVPCHLQLLPVIPAVSNIIFVPTTIAIILIILREYQHYYCRPAIIHMKFLLHFRFTSMKNHKKGPDDSDDNITDDETSSLFSNG
jgi:hypothetical protein